MNYDLKDSGKRETFGSGAVRDSREGKGRYDLIPAGSLHRLAVVLERGSRKYDARNWEQGMPMGRLMDSALRHLFQYLQGQRDEDHLAQAAFNVFALMFVEDQIAGDNLPGDLDDLPDHAGVLRLVTDILGEERHHEHMKVHKEFVQHRHEPCIDGDRCDYPACDCYSESRCAFGETGNEARRKTEEYRKLRAELDNRKRKVPQPQYPNRKWDVL